MLIEQFCEGFPGWYYDPDRWPTLDGVIPYPLFMVLLDTLPARRARWQIVVTQAVQHGYQLAKNPDDTALQSASALLIDQAYPLDSGRSRLTTHDPAALIANDGAWGKRGGLWLLERE